MPHNWPFQFQSTHPSGVRLHAPCSFARRWYFNPRTPVGCDFGHDLAVAVVVISIHAPQWGATAMSRQALQRMKFQSTHPSGVRLDAGDGTGHVLVISIHAPQWGATSSAATSRLSTGIFQSTHPSGVRRNITTIWVPAIKFQSTHPSGVRRYHRHAVRRVRQISIHAPQWGATLRPVLHTVHGRISIHAPQWGATATQPITVLCARISIHAPQWGATWS